MLTNISTITPRLIERSSTYGVGEIPVQEDQKNKQFIVDFSRVITDTSLPPVKISLEGSKVNLQLGNRTKYLGDVPEGSGSLDGNKLIVSYDSIEKCRCEAESAARIAKAGATLIAQYVHEQKPYLATMANIILEGRDKDRIDWFRHCCVPSIELSTTAA